ncbi:MAG: 1-(5-phosphoribosyl)-5-[(5-phosphoribosylamino)methylideneamino]imidazole-4-carboxamide isomerase [Marinifilaceae bacterium]
MSRIEIIPAIDLIGGKCVRLTNGDYATEKVYSEDPVLVAKEFEEAGIQRLHLVDLDGAREGYVVNLPVLERIISQTNLAVDFGGGLSSDEDLKKVLNCGAKQVTGGSIAVRNTELFSQWLKTYGPDQIILGADVKGNRIAVSGWQEESSLILDSFLEEYLNKGVEYVICTDISRDGALNGPAVELYRELLAKFPKVKLIASGGVSCLDDIRELEEAGLYGVILGKAIYEGRIQLSDLVNQFVL